MYTVLIFYPGTESYIGLWQPNHTSPWQTQPVVFGQTEHNALFTALTELLKSTALTLPDITHIGVMPGPASYTQLRSFVAAANSIAWANQVPLFTLDPSAVIPDNLGHLLSHAHRNVPIEPHYLHPVL